MLRYVRDAVLGSLTGCCQLLKGYGDAYVRYGIQHPVQNKNANRKFKLFKCTEDELRKKLDKESRILLEADQASNQTFILLLEDSNVGRMAFK